MEITKKIWEKYKIEVVLILSSLVIACASLNIFLNNQAVFKNEDVVQEISTFDKNFDQKIIVDVSGSVVKPNVYKLDFGARIKDAIIVAGGLSKDADKVYFARNFNLARLLNDQEKLYVPSVWEIENGIIIEQTNRNTVFSNSNSNNLININEASEQELDTLPGVGKVTVDKIISNRPYKNLEELLNKKVLGKSVYEKLKDLIEI